jgi:hypothetical protein
MYHASLDLSPFMEPYPYSRYDVVFKSFDPATTFPDSAAMSTIVRGILEQAPFYAGKS